MGGGGGHTPPPSAPRHTDNFDEYDLCHCVMEM
jgi:hypothetical protein